MMNKRDVVLSLLDREALPPYTPAAFFLHFDPEFHRGRPAVDKHLEYFRYTGMDFVKIQYEKPFPRLPSLQRPADWAGVPSYGRDFFEDPLAVIAGLVEEAKREALVIVTLYSPFMCAGHAAGLDTLTAHIEENPAQVKKGMEIITESMLLFVRECIKLGVDGFYASTQGGEAGRFDDVGPFNECVKPYDLAVMDAINEACAFNILHVCDYHLGYDDFSPFLDYPGDVVNAPLHLGRRPITAAEVSEMFGRPYMGGMDRHGAIASGGAGEIKRAAEDVIRDAPARFILGADCTVPGDTGWDNLKTAIETAHAHSPQQ